MISCLCYAMGERIRILLILLFAACDCGESNVSSKCVSGYFIPQGQYILYNTSIHLSCESTEQISLVSVSVEPATDNCTVNISAHSICFLSSNITSQNETTEICNGKPKCTAVITAFAFLSCAPDTPDSVSMEVSYVCTNHFQETPSSTVLTPTSSTSASTESQATSTSMVVAPDSSSTADIVARSATSSQRMISVAGAEPTTSVPPTTAADFNSSLDDKDRGTNVVIIALSVVICVLLIVVTVVSACMCRRRRNRTLKCGETSRNVAPLTVHQHTREIPLSGVVNTYVPNPLAANPESTTLPFNESRDRQTFPENTYWEVDLTYEDDRRPKQPDCPRKNCDFNDYVELKTHTIGRDGDSGYSEVNLEHDAPVTVIQIADADRRTPERKNIEGCKSSIHAGSRQNAGYDHIKVNRLGLDFDNTNDTAEDNHRKVKHGMSAATRLLNEGVTCRIKGEQYSSDNSQSDSSMDFKNLLYEESKSDIPNGYNSVCNFELAQEVRKFSEVETLEQADIQTKSDGHLEHDYFTLETTEKEVKNSHDDDCNMSLNDVGDLNANNAETKGTPDERPVNEYFKDGGNEKSLGNGDHHTLVQKESASAGALSNTDQTSVLPPSNSKDDTYNHLIMTEAKDELHYCSKQSSLDHDAGTF